ncbi:MAG: PAS domain S-box protein [Dehalococcoidia bacterium]|nr:PAS domain S-box protein [Dehalococcoidia bacterium]MDD5647790.1 PAS domain S-box protein [Dehalococcoidia bacterium]
MTRILIADDNEQNLYLLETVLKSQGYDVISVRNGAEAIESASENPPDIIVTDILMPVMDGFELCRRWRANELLSQVPFVFYTATYTDLKDEKFALSLGADRFVVKPQQPEVLVKIIQEVLNKPRKVKPVSRKNSPEKETKELQQYNEVLFRKLEKKVKQLEDVITKQKNTEDELRESELKHRTLITQSPDGIFIVDLKGNFLAVNRVMYENLKYSEKELLSMGIWDIVPEQYIEQHKKRLAEIITGKAPNEAAEYIVRAKDGGLYVVEITSAPYYEGGKLVGFQGVARDITERRKAEDLLRSSEEKYRSLVENINDVFYTLDDQGTITYISPVVERLSKYKVSDLIGKSFTSIIFPEDLPDVVSSYNRLISGQIEPAEFRIADKDGRIIYVRTSSRPIFKDGKIVGITALITDVTERKLAEQDLIKSYQKVRKTLNDAINTMAKIVEMRDPYTAGHQHRVAELSIAIAKELGYRGDHIENLYMAALIHDIGKIYVPSDILSKPGRLTNIEFNLVKTHAQGSYDILRNMEFPTSVAQSVLQHHERLDGSGYPSGLRGEAVCREARLIAVADVVEAMSSHRPYRPALGMDKALEEISANKGKLYDGAVVDACLNVFRKQGFKFE